MARPLPLFGRANTKACEEFFARYFDQRGYLLCVERRGGDDGPDDAIENVADWPILRALGASDSILHMYKKAWEGHLRQYTQAKTVEVPFARNGMLYKEFHCMMDWMHIGEELRVFNLQGLSDPDDVKFGYEVQPRHGRNAPSTDAGRSRSRTRCRSAALPVAVLRPEKTTSRNSGTCRGAR